MGANKKTVRKIKQERQHVTFAKQHRAQIFSENQEAIKITYNLGADGNYLSEASQQQAKLSIFRQFIKRIRVSNGGINRDMNETTFHFSKL